MVMLFNNSNEDVQPFRQDDEGVAARVPAVGVAADKPVRSILTSPVQLQSGQRLGPYEIVERIGAGGMGEVYRARDTRLSRSVAIKVLRGALRDDPRLRARFDREAKTISSLSDPHICALHDIGSHNGVDYLVLEYCDGITLAQRLDRGPLGIEQVLPDYLMERLWPSSEQTW